MTPAGSAAAARPRVEGDREQEILRRDARRARRRRLRPADHGRRRHRGQGVQGHALPPLEHQGRARHRRRARPEGARPRSPTPAPCAATCSRCAAAWAASPTAGRWRVLASVITAIDRDAEFAERVPARLHRSQGRHRPHASRAGPGPRRDPRGPRPRPGGARPGRDRPAPDLPARRARHRRADRRGRSTRSSSPPAAPQARPTRTTEKEHS